MASLWRRMIKTVHPEGIPAGCTPLYDAIARSSIFRRHYELVAQDVAAHCPAGRLLDIGTGPARLLPILHQRAPQLQLTGLDISPGMIARARKTLTETGLDKTVELVCAPAARLPFPDATFNAVISTGSIHHWKDPVAALNECHRVLVPGGVALIYDLLTKLPSDVSAAAKRQFGRFRIALLWLHSFEEPFYTREQMADLAAQTAFAKGDTRFVGVLCCLTLRKPPRP